MRSVSFLHLLVLVLFAMEVYCSEAVLQGKLILPKNIETLSPGDIVSLKFQISPFGKIGDIKAKELVGKFILQSFFVISGSDSTQSPNNSDVLEMDLVTALARPFDPKNIQSLEIGKLIIPIVMEDIKIETTKNEPQSFQLLSHQVEDARSWWKKYLYWILGVLLIALFLIPILYKKVMSVLRKKRHLREEREELKAMIEEFNLAQHASDFERLYAAKAKWQKLIPNSSEGRNFINKMDEFQYKRSWEINEELVTIKEKLLEELKKRMQTHGV